MNSTQIETNLQSLTKAFSKNTFIYDLLLAYGLPKASISRLQNGNMNLSKLKSEIDWKKKLFFKEACNEDVHELFAATTTDIKSLKHDPRFVIITDFETLLALDTKTKDKLDIPIENIAQNYDFFLPWAGMEKTQIQHENPADVKAAERMAKLYDEIKKDNPTDTPAEIHSLNVFLSRLLFCFFSEDTGIFLPKGLFTNGISSNTQPDGSDLCAYLDTLFKVLNTENRSDSLAVHFNIFPYVNGGLFANKIIIPTFTRRSRQAIIDSGQEDWSAINPDIFGSMIQAVISPEHRSSLGMHYTSVPNIMKVIKPLFLDELYEEFEKVKYDFSKLNKLLARIGKIKIFDPACGSGNFLIIAYKELRLLELKILDQLKTFSTGFTGFEEKQTVLFTKPQLILSAAASSFQMPLFSCIELHNFYGIEIDDFAHEIAILSLWLAQHQMNVKFLESVGQAIASLPLKAGGNIVKGNATRLDWEIVCPKTTDAEIYILGNPPYLGFNMQSNKQSEDIQAVLPDLDNLKFLDYIVCWFIKASKFIDARSQFAFVTTNSVCQGTQVPIIWPQIFKLGLEISFAYPEFRWSNSAKNNAAVICSIIGVRTKSIKPKYLYISHSRHEVKNINAYLANGGDIIVEKRQIPISNISHISTGNIPYDGGNLILSTEEKTELLLKYPEAIIFIKKLSGSKEFINDLTRYCLWIEDENVSLAMSIPPIKERIDKVKKSREEGGKIAKNYSNTPFRFYMTNRPKKNQILIPRVSSMKREYIPTGFLERDTIISDSAQAIYDPMPFVFGIINSHMHMVWVKALAGRLKTDYRYSAVICYNTFPLPPILDNKKQELEILVYNILEEREHHSEKTLAQLYDPDKMPQGLREAHHQLDLAVERCYRIKPFESDEERLEYLFKLYEQMIAEEKTKGTLFDGELKTKKKKK